MESPFSKDREGTVRLFYHVVLALCLFIGIYAAVTGHWITLIGSAAVLLFFVLYPYELI